MSEGGAGIGGDFGFGILGGYRSIASNREEPLGSVLYASNGRAALSVLANHIASRATARRNTVLLPGYLCHTMIQPFPRQKFSLRFYDVGDDLRINFNAIMQQYDDDVIAVLVMSYFGHDTLGDTIYDQIRRAADCTIIDDRTHMLLTDMMQPSPGRRAADCVIYSVRKWGPFPDLALFLAPNEFLAELDKTYDREFFTWRVIELLLRGLFFAWPVDVLRATSLAAYHRAEQVLDRRCLPRQASRLSKNLWKSWDWRDACETRRANFMWLSANWPSKKAHPVFSTLPKYVCPMGFPVKCDRRDDLRKWFIENGIFPPVHWPRPPETQHMGCKNAEYFYAHELTIPIDQRYTMADMERIVDRVCAF